MTEKQHKPLTFLLVDIKWAGSDMIELAGQIDGINNCGRDWPWKLRDLEKAVTDAQHSIANYRRAVETGKPTMTRAEYGERLSLARAE